MARRKTERKKAAPEVALESQPTVERMRHARGGWEIGGDDRARVRVITMKDSPLERARARGVLGAGNTAIKRYAAGERFYLHWYRAGMAGRLSSVDFDRVDYRGSLAEAESTTHHRQEYTAAVQRLGMISSAILEAVICREVPFEQVAPDLGWRSKSKGCEAVGDRLLAALDSLCELWGL